MLKGSSRRAWIGALAAWLSIGAVASCGARSVLDAPEGDDTGGAGPGSGGAGPGGGGSGSVIISLSDQSVIESEAHVATAPNGFVAVAWISIPDSGPGGIGYTFSVNDGDAFQPVTVIQSPEGRDSSDPVLAADGAGNFWLTWVGFYRDPNTGEPFDMRIYVAKAAAGTTTFGDPVEASDPSEGSLADKPWITVTGQGSLLVTYGREGPGDLWGIVASRSSDGVNWKRAVLAEDPLQSNTFRNLAFPCAVPGTPRVYVVYVKLGAGQSIQLHRSDDDGASFPAPTEIQVNAPGEQVAFDGPSCVASGEDVWVSYGLSNVGGGSEESAVLFAVRLARSFDGGQSIGDRINAHDPGAAGFYLHPQLAMEESGAINLAYYAGNFDKDTGGSFRRGRSTDSGQSFGSSLQVGTPIVFLPDRGDPQWLGDYTGLAWRAGSVYMAYTDNASGFAHVAFSRAAVP